MFLYQSSNFIWFSSNYPGSGTIHLDVIISGTILSNTTDVCALNILLNIISVVLVSSKTSITTQDSVISQKKNLV